MVLNFIKNTVLILVFVAFSCGNKTTLEARIPNTSTTSTTSTGSGQTSSEQTGSMTQENDDTIIVGANQTEKYIPLLKGKKVGIVANQTSVIFKQIARSQNAPRNDSYAHLVDSLVSLKVNVTKVFAPEHGFRGQADAGEKVVDGIDTKTGLPIFSLYGKHRKPNQKQLDGLDIIIFDIQDVGARFYTYISTLHYVMEACAEQNIPLLILDRPNPNGHYIDGPIMEAAHQSFVGMHPVPVVHGMTIGEYAQMINGQGWLANNVACDITIIPVKNYTHQTAYSLPINPSPNLPNDVAINLYPSLCFFEGTNVSAGRGTEKQFQIFGSPFLNKDLFNYDYEFTPQSNHGAKYPKHENSLCYGKDLSQTKRLSRLDLNYLIEAYQATSNKAVFFNDYFTKLAGTKQLQKDIEGRLTAYELRKTWIRNIMAYDKMRSPYLLYTL